jgi:hypothetical protein
MRKRWVGLLERVEGSAERRDLMVRRGGEGVMVIK